MQDAGRTGRPRMGWRTRGAAAQGLQAVGAGLWGFAEEPQGDTRARGQTAFMKRPRI